jgi:glycosyltransferase involved in cell wall biosynthesis
LLRALGAIAERHSHVHLMLVGARADHYDVTADAVMHGVSDRVHITGFVADDELPAYLHAADIAVCLRWPTNRETSASWLRCLAAGRPTIITDLAHLGDVPSLDPRGWRMLDTARERREPIAVSVDPLDEDHSLQLALERLVDDRALRDRLGRAARAWWHAHHQLETMADAYLDAMRTASRAPVPNPPLPAHLLADGTTTMREIGEAFGVSDRLLT